MADPLTVNQDALSLFFTEDIYLVDRIEDVAAEVQKIAPRAFKFLGNNKRNILIIVNDKANDVSDEKGRELLRKIVKSVNLSAADFALLNYASCDGADFNELLSSFSSKLIFSFGVSPSQLNLPDHPFNTIIDQAGVRMIFSLELRQLEEDMVAKKVLWGSLQKLAL